MSTNTIRLHRVLRATLRRPEPTEGTPGDDNHEKVAVGTELHIVQEGVPDVLPAEACYLGRQEPLVLLAKLVEAEIPG